MKYEDSPSAAVCAVALLRPGPDQNSKRDNLHLAGAKTVGQTAHLSEIAIAVPEPGAIKAGAIEGIERLHTHLELCAFPNAELLPQAHVDVGDPLGVQIIEVSRRVAELLISWIGETGRVNDGGPVIGAVQKRRCRIVIADAGARRAARNIGTLPAARDAVAAHLNVHRLSGLQRNIRRNRPAADERVEPAVHVRAEQQTAAQRQVSCKGSRQTMRGIVGADRVFVA